MTERRRSPSVLNALHIALRAAPPGDQDAAAVALAKRYAHELDHVETISLAANKALRKLAKEDIPDGLFEEFEALAARVEEVHVAALIGPKLLTALTELQMTPAARRAVMTPPAGPKSKLDELRERRESRDAAPS